MKTLFKPVIRKNAGATSLTHEEQLHKKKRHESVVLVGSDGVNKIKLHHDNSIACDVYSWFEITVQEVDVPAQTFTCSIEIHVFWQDFTFPNVFPNFEKEEFILDPESVPFKINEIFENKVSLDIQEGPIYKFLAETSTLYCSVIVECTFTERMELHRFPLDRQFLNILFNAWVEKGNWNWILDYPDWVPEEFRKPFASRLASSITEYELLPAWIDFSTKQPLVIRLRVSRKPAYYFGNVVFPNFLIVSGCLTALVIHPGDVSDRLGVSITLMLAAVAFRFVVSSMLPKVSYLTFMDYYLLIGFIALMILIGENAIVGSLPSSARPLTDYTFAAVFTITWIVIHFVAILVVIKKKLFRLSWRHMDLLDKSDDTGDFISAVQQDIKTLAETEDSKEIWNKYKHQTPEQRAKSYAALGLSLQNNDEPQRKKSNETISLASPVSAISASASSTPNYPNTTKNDVENRLLEILNTTSK